MGAFCGWDTTASRLYRATMWSQFSFYQKFLVLISSVSEGWKAEMTWSHPVVLNLCINLVITKYKLKSQFKLTQLWPLTVNCFKVSSQSYLAGLSKICFLCTCHNFIWLVNFIENVYLGAKDFFGIKWKNPR